MMKKWLIALSVLTVANILLAIAFLSREPRALAAGDSGQAAPGTERYILYIGLNDKDTRTQLVSIEEAERRLNAVAAGYVEGFTVFRGKGYWTDESGGIDHEQTLAYVFYDATERRIAPMIDDMLAAMNQSAILVEKGDVFREYRTGKSSAQIGRHEERRRE